MFINFFLLTANLGLVLLIFLCSIHRAICRPSDHALCGEALGRDSNLGRADLVAGTLDPPVPGLFTRTKNVISADLIHVKLREKTSQN